MGLKKLDQIISDGTAKKLDGRIVFELYDTFGFPLDLTALIARERGWEIDEEGFQSEMLLQKERSKKAASTQTGDWIPVYDSEDVEFVGYDQLTSNTKIVKYRSIRTNNKEQFQVVLDNTPFYAESGGQAGDTGVLRNANEKIKVLDTKKENDLIIHFTDKLPSDFSLSFEAIVDQRKRKLTENNHSATHLLHAALRKVLGEHVHQKGSLVNDKLLRFDFSHFAKLTEEEIHAIEKLVNEKIRENIPLNEQRNVPIGLAKELGATALFGEKYGEFVRVITFDKNYSVELCGGTHVASTGQIGQFKIVSESSVAAGVRRIEAVTAAEAESYFDEQLKIINQLKELLKNPKDLSLAVAGLIEEKTRLEKTVELFYQQEGVAIKESLLQKVKVHGDVNVIVDQIKIGSADTLKQIVFELKAKVTNLFLVVAAEIDGKPQISVMLSEDLVKSKGLNANEIVKELAKEIQGGGGGQPFYATAGGKNPDGLKKVIEKAKSLIEKQYNSTPA